MALPTALDLLREFVETKSTFFEPPFESEMADKVEHYLHQLGFRVTRQEVARATVNGTVYTRFNLLAEKGEGDAALLLYGHMDTVKIAVGWQRDPLKATVEGDRLYGLGGHDMKAGLVALLKAVENTDPEGYKLKLAFLVDEENNSLGAYVLTKSGWLSDVVAAFVPESGTSSMQAEGARMMTLGRRGRITVRIDINGLSAHAAQAEQGVSALVFASRICVALHEAALSGDLPLAQDDALVSGGFSIRSLTSSATDLSVPDSAAILIDRHLVRGETTEQALADIRTIVAQVHQGLPTRDQQHLAYEIAVPDRGNPYLMPYVVDAAHPLVVFTEQSICRQLELDTVTRNYGLSVADENYFGADKAVGGMAIPTIVVGTAGMNNHSPDEWVSLQSLDELIRVYRDVVQNFGSVVNQLPPG